MMRRNTTLPRSIRRRKADERCSSWHGAIPFCNCRVVFSFTACAEQQTVDGVEYFYTISGGMATINSVQSTIAGGLTIPPTLGGKPMMSIGDYAFYKCSGLRSVTIPESVTRIGWYAFYNCGGLTNIMFIGNASGCGGYAFSGVGSGCTGMSRKARLAGE